MRSPDVQPVAAAGDSHTITPNLINAWVREGGGKKPKAWPSVAVAEIAKGLSRMKWADDPDDDAWLREALKQRGIDLMLTVFHRTTPNAAKQILRGGFRDATGSYGTTRDHNGVFVSDQPLDINEGARGKTLLRIDIAEKLIAKYEWIEKGKPYREWCVPAAIINKSGRVKPGDNIPWEQFALGNEAAKTLRTTMPALLAFWKDQQWSPITKGGYPAMRALEKALAAARDYVDHPFGKYRRQDHREKRRPRPWHMPAVVIADMISRALAPHGITPKFTRDTAATWVAHQALQQTGYGGVDTNTIATFLKRRERPA